MLDITIRPTDLKTNLVNCSNHARDAFRESQSNVGKAKEKIELITESAVRFQSPNDDHYPLWC